MLSNDTLTEFILKNNPDRSRGVMEYYGNILTIDDILLQTDRTAKAMTQLGVKENDHILVFLRAVPEFIFILLAAEKIGAAIVCHDGEPDEKAAAINQSGAKIAFSFDFISDEEERIFYEKSDLEHLILVSPYYYAKRKEIPDYIENSIEKLYDQSSCHQKNSIIYHDFLALGEKITYDVSIYKNPNRPLYCSYTSGSTYNTGWIGL